MPPASIAAAVRRVGARLARPSSLLAAAAAGAVVGFSVTRLGGAGALARGLAAAALRHGAALYVRYRTARDDAPAEDAAHG